VICPVSNIQAGIYIRVSELTTDSPDMQTQENIQVLLRATGTQQPVQHSSFRNKVKSPRSLATDNVTERLESNEPSGDLSRPKEISGPASFLMADSGEDNGIAKELAAIRATLEDMREARVFAQTETFPVQSAHEPGEEIQNQKH
jgi:hypothetical protein